MRWMLVVPGGDGPALAAALNSGADALILDLTGGVEGRQLPAAFLTGLGDAPRPRLYVRVHPLVTGLTDADLDIVLPARPDGIVLPRMVGATDVQQLGAKLAVREAEHGLPDGSTRVVAMIDSARGLLAIATLPGASPRLAGIAWDATHLAADLRVETPRDEAGRWTAPFAHARTMVLLTAAAAGVEAIDTAICEGTGLARDCAARGRDGFAATIAMQHIGVARGSS